MHDTRRDGHLQESVIDRAIQPVRVAHLPAQATALLGREKDNTTVRDRLLRPDCHLLTVLGAGGIGKTRLALAVAEEVADSFTDGVCFVDLTQIADPAVLPSLLATELGVPVDEHSPLERVQAYLRDKQLLLVLDNVEHVLAGALVVAELLTLSPGLTVLCTSREPLQLRWEQRFLLGPLEVPDLHGEPMPEEVQGNPSVTLFLQRARAVNLRFQADDETLHQIAAICVCLEGVPLAIELAAARTNVLSPAAILERLEQHATFLQQRAPDVPARHESLQATLKWSYHLLSEDEQTVFRRLGVFLGGFTLEAAEAVMGGTGHSQETIDVLSSLTDKSLLLAEVTPEGMPRHRFLKTVHAYALAQLRATDEMDEVRRRHARYYCALAEAVSANRRSSGYLVFSSPATMSDIDPLAHLPWPTLMDREQANLRAAWEWAQQHDRDMLLHLSNVLARYLWVRDVLPHGAPLLAEALQESVAAEPDLRSGALSALAALYRQQGDFERARLALEEAVALSDTLDESDMTTAQLIDLANICTNQSRLSQASAVLHHALERSRAAGDDWGTGAALTFLGELELSQGRLVQAEEFFAASLLLFRRLDDRRSAALVGATLAQAIWLQGDVPRALPFLADALGISRDLGQASLIAYMIELTVSILAEDGQPSVCARLLEAGEALRAEGYQRTSSQRAMIATASSALRARQSPEDFAAARSEGRLLSGSQALDEAAALVQATLAAYVQPGDRGQPATGGILSRREQQVLALLAEGCANKDIGGRLGISDNTVKYHVTSILNKLGVNGRAEAVAVAVKQGLI